MGIRLYLIFPIIISFSCATQPNFFEKVKVGQNKQTIKEFFGELVKIKKFPKPVGPIFGPEEEFWDQIQNGAPLEVWNYQSKEGNLNLYFLNGEESLSYKAFAPRGVVY
jgi:hypothetical protein